MPLEALSTDPEDPVQSIERDVTVAGVRLRTTEWSRPYPTGQEEPVILIHGALSPRASLEPMARRLGSRFRAMTVDLPGFGDSEKPPKEKYPYGVRGAAESLLGLFSGLGISRAHVYGHGLGGLVAIHLAAKHPEIIRRLALCAPPLSYSPELMGFLTAPWVGGLVFRQLLGAGLFAKVYRDRIWGDVPAATLDTYFQSFTPPAARAAVLATLRGSMDVQGAIADVRRIRSPSLILWGRKDRLIPVEAARLFSRELPSSGLELIDAGHAPHEESPAAVAAILSRFFDGRRAGAG